MYVGYKLFPSSVMYITINLISAFYLTYTLLINSLFPLCCLLLLIPYFIRVPLKYAVFVVVIAFIFRKKKTTEDKEKL